MLLRHGLVTSADTLSSPLVQKQFLDNSECHVDHCLCIHACLVYSSLDACKVVSCNQSCEQPYPSSAVNIIKYVVLDHVYIDTPIVISRQILTESS